MTQILLAYLGGLLTIVSPCILPIAPLVFSQGHLRRSERALMLAGLAATFAVVAGATTASASWVAGANEIGRWLALAVFALIGASLVSDRLATVLSRPVVALGARLDAGTRHANQGVTAKGTPADRHDRSSERALPGRAVTPLVTGAALGLLWAPCAGPILGLVIVGGVTLSATPGHTLVSLVAFAAGAGTSLGLVLVAGQRVLHFLKRSTIVERRIRRMMGAAVVIGVVAIALGWDNTLLAKGSFVQTAAAEELLISRLAPPRAVRTDAGVSLDAFAAERSLVLGNEGGIPEFPRNREWINSEPLTTAALKGKVVLVDFWTFDCINCLHALPYVKALYAKYKDEGFVVIGVHTPELPRERIPANVRAAVTRLGITYPVVIDGDYAIWNAWKNQYWPAAYYVDASGEVRFHHFGEGRYDEQEAVVRKLLDEAKRGAAGR